jgi:hypothetical protein
MSTNLQADHYCLVTVSSLLAKPLRLTLAARQVRNSPARYLRVPEDEHPHLAFRNEKTVFSFSYK